MKNCVMFLSYKHNVVTCQIYNESEVRVYLSSVNCSISERDNKKLDSFRQGLQWLGLQGYRGTLNVYLVGVYFEKWMTGVSVPPRSLLRNAFRAVRAMDTCGFRVKFNQVSRVHKHGEEIPKEKSGNLLELMLDLEEDLEEEYE